MFDLLPLRMDIAQLEKVARQLRSTCLQMAFNAKEGHITSALSCVDILVALYYEWLRIDPKAPRDPGRDRFLFSKGHAASALYATLGARGFFPVSELLDYCKPNSPFPNHPCRHKLSCLEISSGSLGHGLGIGSGMAYSLKLKRESSRVVVLMSDGECNEGSVWETAGFACAQKLSNLLAIVDHNNMQAVGRTNLLLGPTKLEDKFNAFGWSARTIDGHDISSILAALNDFPFHSEKPSVIICKTYGGQGVSFMKDQTTWHYRVPSVEELTLAFKELNEQPLISTGR